MKAMKPQRVGEVREIGEDDLVVADDAADLAHLGVRQLEELHRAGRARA